ncbi:unnamed protein product [Gordionus sp. m RMFG-2023]|uniref:uncharacterized protein LOC135929112 isoform X2 n=1 Tax=Gordionus sp. m RMFG-2023 TaxID=3053472 RepID=UPI0030DFE6C2
MEVNSTEYLTTCLKSILTVLNPYIASSTNNASTFSPLCSTNNNSIHQEIHPGGFNFSPDGNNSRAAAVARNINDYISNMMTPNPESLNSPGIFNNYQPNATSSLSCCNNTNQLADLSGSLADMQRHGEVMDETRDDGGDGGIIGGNNNLNYENLSNMVLQQSISALANARKGGLDKRHHHIPAHQNYINNSNANNNSTIPKSHHIHHHANHLESNTNHNHNQIQNRHNISQGPFTSIEPKDEKPKAQVTWHTYNSQCCDVTVILVHSPTCPSIAPPAVLHNNLTNQMAMSTNDISYQNSLHIKQPLANLTDMCLADMNQTQEDNEEEEEDYKDSDIVYGPKQNKTPRRGSKKRRNELRQKRKYVKWTREKMVEADTLIEEAIRRQERNQTTALRSQENPAEVNAGEGYSGANNGEEMDDLGELSDLNVKKLSEMLQVSLSSLYKYLKLTRPDYEGGPRKSLVYTLDEGYISNSIKRGRPVSNNKRAKEMEIREEVTKIMSIMGDPNGSGLILPKGGFNIAYLMERLPDHLKCSKDSLRTYLRRMNWMEKKKRVNALTACNVRLNAGGGGDANMAADTANEVSHDDADIVKREDEEEGSNSDDINSIPTEVSTTINNVSRAIAIRIGSSLGAFRLAPVDILFAGTLHLNFLGDSNFTTSVVLSSGGLLAHYEFDCLEPPSSNLDILKMGLTPCIDETLSKYSGNMNPMDNKSKILVVDQNVVSFREKVVNPLVGNGNELETYYHTRYRCFDGKSDSILKSVLVINNTYDDFKKFREASPLRSFLASLETYLEGSLTTAFNSTGVSDSALIVRSSLRDYFENAKKTDYSYIYQNMAQILWSTQ